jgi:hypothetical protein
MAACACCFTTGLVWLHPSRADWPPSYSYRGRIGSLALRLACSPCESLPAPLLKPTLARLRAEQAIYTVNSFQFTRSTRLILAYPTNGRHVTSSLYHVFSSQEGFGKAPSHRKVPGQTTMSLSSVVVVLSVFRLSPRFHPHSGWAVSGPVQVGVPRFLPGAAISATASKAKTRIAVTLTRRSAVAATPDRISSAPRSVKTPEPGRFFPISRRSLLN